MAGMPIRPEETPASEAGREGPADLDPGRLARWAAGAIAAMAVAQVLFLTLGCDWDLCGDEAEYWTWSRRLDWSYHSKGPLIALVIRLGTAVAGGASVALTGTLMPAVRLPAVLLGALTAWGVFRLGAEAGGRARAGLVAVLLLPAVPLFRLGGVLMTVDTPLVCCWTWAAVWAYRGAVRDDGRAWAAAGAVAAVGVLAKLTMLAFPASVGLFLVLSRGHRRQLVRPGFWVFTAACALGLVPILAWNARHGWPGAEHLSVRLGLASPGNWGRARTLLAFLGGEAVVWGLWWPVGVLALARAVLRGRPTGPGRLYLVCLWGVVWSACVAAAALGETEANWAAPAHVAVLVLAGVLLDGAVGGEARRRAGFALAGAWVFSVAGLTALEHTERLYPALAPFLPAPSARCPAPVGRLDPTCRMRGYREVGRAVARQLAALRAGGEEPFVLAPTYTTAAALSFYLPGRPDAYCLTWTPGMAARVANQHDLWHPNPRHDPGPFRGRPAVVVEGAGGSAGYARGLARRGAFREAGPTSRVEVRRGGLVVAAWDLTVCRGYRGLEGAGAMRALLAAYASPAYYAARGGTPAGFVRGLYRDLLGRAPGPADLAFWSDLLATRPRDEVVAVLAEAGQTGTGRTR